MVLSFGDGVPLRDRVELFEEHRLNRLTPKVEQNGPGLGHVHGIYVYEV